MITLICLWLLVSWIALSVYSYLYAVDEESIERVFISAALGFLWAAGLNVMLLVLGVLAYGIFVGEL